MEQGQIHPLEQAQKILGAFPEEFLGSLCTDDIIARKSVVDGILRQLHSEVEATQADVLQSIPIAMLMEQKYIEVLQFIELCIERGGYFSPEVITKVLRIVNTGMLQIQEEGDEESAHTLSVLLYQFYNTILKHSFYRENPDIFISVGANLDEAGKIQEAIRLYTHAIGLGSHDAATLTANALERIGKYSESARVLDTAYRSSGDQRFLQCYISALSKSGKRAEAYKYYLELMPKDTKFIDGDRVTALPPFITFTEEIHSDHDLGEFESLLTEHHKVATFLPNPQLRNLAENASVYISNEIQGINTFLQAMENSPVESWTEEQARLYMDSIKRRLYLMQMHIIMLQDHQYLDLYLLEIKKYTVEGNPLRHKMMREFFMEHSSLYTRAAYDHVSGGNGEDDEKKNLLEDTKIHLVHIKALFSQGTFYETIRDSIEPLIALCNEQLGKSTDVSSIEDAVGEFHYTNSETFWRGSVDTDIDRDRDMRAIRSEEIEYEKLSASTLQLYEDFVGFIDTRYGMFYRRSLQQLIRDIEAMPPGLMGVYEAAKIKHNENEEAAYRETIRNMPALLENPYIALFFFIEKVLLGEDYLEEGQSMEDWVMKYGLDNIGKSNALLLASVLYENGFHDDATEYLIHVSGMLEVPQALYMIMESVRYMSQDGDEKEEGGEENEEEIVENKNLTQMMQVLDGICKENYDIDTFFEYFRSYTDEVFAEGSDSDDEEIGYTLLASANMKLTQDGDIDEIIAEFTVAGEYRIVGGYIGAGNILQEHERYDEAIVLFLLAHQLSPSILTIRSLSDVYMSAGRFDDAWKILSDAARDGYDVAGYKAACYLYEGKIKECIREFSKILRGIEYTDMTFPDEGFSTDLLTDIANELGQNIESGEQFGTAILGSYIQASYGSESEPLDTENYLRHITYIYKLLDTYPLGVASEVLISSLPLLTGMISSPHAETIESIALDILQDHLAKIHQVLTGHHRENMQKRDTEATYKSFDLLDRYIKAARSIIQKFPNSQIYMNRWERGLNFIATQYHVSGIIHEMPSTIQ